MQALLHLSREMASCPLFLLLHHRQLLLLLLLLHLTYHVRMPNPEHVQVALEHSPLAEPFDRRVPPRAAMEEGEG